MALHPFRTFRKHQKVIWGVLVIVCMLTFVLAGTGRGDLFDRISQMVGRRRSGTAVTKLYGQNIDARQLQDLKQQRSLALQALTDATKVGLGKIDQEEKTIQDAQKKGLEPKDIMAQFQQQQDLQSKRQTLIQRFAYLYNGQSRLSSDGLLEFLIWQHQADKLGIQLTPQDVDAELKRTTSGLASLGDVLPGVLRSRQQLTEDQVVAALREEFRVALAQQAVLSYDPVSSQPANPFFGQPTPALNQVPAPVTPHEFWTHYEKERTSVDVALVPVPVKVPSAEGTLSEQDQKEIDAMYSRYKDQEASPGQAQPGFKVPRKVKVGWVTARPDSEYFQKSAAEVGQGLRAATAAGSAVGTSVQTGVPMVADPAFLVQYDRMKRPTGADVGNRFDLAGLAQADFALSVYSTRAHPADVAALVGGVATVHVPFAPTSGLFAYQAGAFARNAQDKDMTALIAQETKEKRIPYGVSVLLSGTQTASAVPLQAAFTATTLTAYGYQVPQYLPPTSPLTRQMVAQGERAALAGTLAEGNLKAFQKELDTQRTRGANAVARAKSAADFLPKGVTQFHLESMPKSMAEARDRYDLPKSPAVEPLKEALVQQHPIDKPEQVEEAFAGTFFQGEGEYQPAPWPPERQGGMPPSGTEHGSFLVWRTENNPARVPSFDEVKDQVIAAWRFARSRNVTRDDVDRLTEEFKKTDGDLARVKQLAAEKKLGTPLELNEIARQVPEVLPVATGHQYHPYQFPSTIAFPGGDWVNDLLEKLKNKGDTLVLADQPQKTFYVAVLLDRRVPTLRTFYDVYRDMAVSPQRDPLLEGFVRERREKYRQEFVTRLRIEAGAGPNGQFKLSEDYQKQQESREE